MNKNCPKCGASVEVNAAFCPNCGAKFNQQQQYTAPNQNVNFQGNVPPQKVPYQQPVYQVQQPGQANFILVQQLAQKIKNASIFWLVYGILCAISGIITISVGAAANSTFAGMYYKYYYGSDPGTGAIVYGCFLIIAAIVNIVYAIIHFGYAKTMITNPAVITKKIQSPVLYIVSIVVNVIFGGIIGIIGGIMMLNARSLARGNQFVFQGGNVPNNNIPPYAPPYQNATQNTPVQPPVQPSAPVQAPVETPVEEKESATVVNNNTDDGANTKVNTEDNNKTNE